MGVVALYPCYCIFLPSRVTMYDLSENRVLFEAFDISSPMQL